MFDLALNNAVNLAREYGEAAEDMEVEIVAYGPGLHMVRTDTSPTKARIKSVLESVPGVVMSACGNTITAMEHAEGRKLELLPGVGVVRAGAVRLVALQEAGWSYLRI
ncbi:DsrE family protein [Methylorubrum sp. B1-46]|uniref:DsrE family protein n=1 Tax=Methylorubrum sp. B1-46 TaxID=2897334 RepID=UPI001E4CE1FA|nr:DsrE family protein [Methylorubrum sp. B1-46]UGB26163.1 DsrE family protein [Methylorubrum sp. B1-46]